MQRSTLALTLALLLIVPLTAVAVVYLNDDADSGSGGTGAFVLQAEGPLAPRIEAAVRDYLAANTPDRELTVNQPDIEPDLALLADPAPGATAVTTRYWVPVTHFYNPVDAISAEDVRRVLRGEVADWAALGGDPQPVRVVLPQGEEDAIARATGVDGALLAGNAAVAWVPADDLRAAIAADRWTFSLVPLEQVDFHVHALSVDGIDLVRGTGDPEGYPLAEQVWLAARGGSDVAPGAVSYVRAQLAPALPEPVRMFMLGTTIPSRCSLYRAEAAGNVNGYWDAVRDFLLQSDYTILNLESPISDQAPPPGCREAFVFGAPTAVLPGFVDSGVDLVSLANNHTMDYGWEVLADAKANLESAGIATVGAGEDRAAAHTPYVTEIKGVRFAFLAYDNVAFPYHAEEGVPGVAGADPAALQEDIRAAKAQADVVVVMFQWIPEYIVDPTPEQQELARVAVEAGADFVYGDGPHVVQALQFFDGAFVDYSLGNWIYDQDWSAETVEGAVQEAVWHGDRLVQVTLYPYAIVNWYQPQMLLRNEGRGRGVLERMYGATDRLENVH